ncbi:MAG: polysaccharide biosynthesis protein, partial [Bdellovibrionales bacterium]|nr:polysaccharide biosynthesis protein [Bdellovibrionales bacterium]
GVSTDKACKPVNVMGMTKAIQERIFTSANVLCPRTRFVCVRYGNVLASRGSVIPLFHEQIRNGGPLTITDENMTRFLLSLEDAVDTVIAAITHAQVGETFIPIAPAANMVNVAKALIGKRNIGIKVIGIRPGEKLYESLISEEESFRTYRTAYGYYAIQPILPEVQKGVLKGRDLIGEYSSDQSILDLEGTIALLEKNNLMYDEDNVYDEINEMIG